MNEHETERLVRAWIASQPPMRAPDALRRSVLAIPTAAPVPRYDGIQRGLAWRPAVVPRPAWALLVAVLAAALVGSTLYIGARLLELQSLPPRIPPAVVATAEPSATPAVSPAPLAAACPVLDEYLAASEELRAIDPWNHRDTTMGELSAAYERYRVAAIAAVENASPGLSRLLRGGLGGSVEAIGMAIASLAATTPADSAVPTGGLWELSELIQGLDPPGYWAHVRCDVVVEDPDDYAYASVPANCSPVTSAIERTADGWTITASRDGNARVRVRIADIAFRTSYGSGDAASTPAPGWVYLEARIAYEALADGVLLRARSLPTADFDPQPDGAEARELSNPPGAAAPPAASAALRAGETVEGVAVYEVPATGRVALTGQWLLAESPAREWRYWTVPLPGGVRYCVHADGEGVEVRTR